MYIVKLRKKDSGIITVDGITITYRWKRVEEKTKGLDELEKKGIIIIVEISKATPQMIEESRAPLTFAQALCEKMGPLINEQAASIFALPKGIFKAMGVSVASKGFTRSMSECMKATRIYSLTKVISMQFPSVIFSVSSLAAIGIKDVVPKSIFSIVEPSRIATLADAIKGLSISFDAYPGFSSKLFPAATALASIVKPIKEYQLAAQMNPLGNEFIKIGMGLGANAITTGAIKSFSEIQKQVDSKEITFLEAKEKISTDLETIAVGFDPGIRIDKRELERLLEILNRGIDLKPVETKERLKEKIDYKQKYEVMKVKFERSEMEKNYLIQEMESKFQVIESKINQLSEKIIYIDEKFNGLVVDSKNEVLEKTDIKEIVWMKTRKQLIFLIQQLYDESFLLIDGNIDNMITNHFITKEDKSSRKEENINRIRWVGTLAQLVFLIDRLFEHNFFSKSDILEIDNLIYNHFGDRERNPFKKDSIRSTRHRIKNVNKNGMVKGGEKILEIIKKTENVKE